MAKAVIGNQSAVTVPRQDRDTVRRFYCDVLGGKIMKVDNEKRTFFVCKKNSISCFPMGMSLMKANSYGRQDRSGCKYSPTTWKK